MRPPLLLAAVLAGCVSFHSRDPGPRGRSVDAIAESPEWRVQWQAFGESCKGLPLRVSRLGQGPRRVLWIGGIHGDEREGRIATSELPRAFGETPGASQAVTLTIVEDVNPDGSASNTRGNSRGVDLNRNYPAANFRPSRFFGAYPLDQPEARALHDLILDERPHLVIVAHSWRGDHFVNFDGPAEQLAELFSRRSGYRVQPSEGIAPTPGSLGSWVGGKLGVPVLTIEYERGSGPWTAWHETRDAILAVILER
jgi:hypothetical protein